MRIERVDHRVAAVARQIHAVQMAAYAQEAKLLGAIDFPPLKVTVEDLQTSGESFFAAFVGDEIVGAVSVEPDGEGRGITIASLVVAPAYHRRGIARALLGRVIASYGDDRLAVQTGAKNRPAAALYAQLGFVETHRSFVGAEPLELVKMVRSV